MVTGYPLDTVLFPTPHFTSWGGGLRSLGEGLGTRLGGRSGNEAGGGLGMRLGGGGSGNEAGGTTIL